MGFELTEEQKILREAIKDFAEKDIGRLVNEVEETENFPRQLFTKMGDLGYLCVGYPAEYGGSDMGKMGECIAMEERSRVNAGIASTIMVQSGLATSAIDSHGSKEQKQEYLVPAVKGRKVWRPLA
jgi:alkylation response protein AidB-like acyl-CoA dehydrogenase